MGDAVEDFLSDAPVDEPGHALKAMGSHNHEVLLGRFLDDYLQADHHWKLGHVPCSTRLQGRGQVYH